MILETVNDFLRINFGELDCLVPEERIEVACLILKYKSAIFNTLDIGREKVYKDCLSKSLEILFNELDINKIVENLEKNYDEHYNILKGLFSFNNPTINTMLIDYYAENPSKVNSEKIYNILFQTDSFLQYDYVKYDVASFIDKLQCMPFFKKEKFLEDRKEEHFNYYIDKETSENLDNLTKNYFLLFNFKNKDDVFDVTRACLLSNLKNTFLNLHPSIENFFTNNKAEYKKFLPALYTGYVDEIEHTDFVKSNKIVDNMLTFTQIFQNSPSFTQLDNETKNVIRKEILFDTDALKKTKRGDEVFHVFNSGIEKSILQGMISEVQDNNTIKRRI